MAIEGLEKLKAKIAALPAATKAELSDALNKSADQLVEMQKRLVPVRHGHLRDTIEKRDGRHKLSVIVEAGGPKAFYGRWVEFGTVKMQAEPFFFPAYRALRRTIRGRITRATKKAAEKVAGNGV